MLARGEAFINRRIHSVFLVRKCNFGANAELFYISLRSEAENVYTGYTLYYLMTLMMWKLFWNR